MEHLAFRDEPHGEPLDNDVMVAGYIVMRVAMLAQWVRVARQDPDRRRVAIAFVVTIAIAQVGWTVLALLATCCSDTAGAPGVGPTAAS